MFREKVSNSLLNRNTEISLSVMTNQSVFGLTTEKLSDLLFELANEDRLKILLQIQEKPQRLTQISEKLGLTVQETSRHLLRMSQAKLIVKDAEGNYHLFPYGEYVLRELSGLEFLSQNRAYFTTHSLSNLPDEYIARLGELKVCTFTDDVMVAFSKAENLIQDAQEYVWIIGNQVLMSTVPLLEEAIKKGVTFRLILPEDLIPPPGFKPLPNVPGRIERRTLKQVNVTIIMSE